MSPYLSVHMAVIHVWDTLSQMLFFFFLFEFLLISDLCIFYLISAVLSQFHYLINFPFYSLLSYYHSYYFFYYYFFSAISYISLLHLSLLSFSILSYPILFSSCVYLTSLLSYPSLPLYLLSSITQRKDLKVVLMSATLNAELFSNYFKNEGKIRF